MSCNRQASTIFSLSPPLTAWRALCSKCMHGPNGVEEIHQGRFCRHLRQTRIVAHQHARLRFCAIAAAAFGAGPISASAMV